jgi:hypothetical protein
MGWERHRRPVDGVAAPPLWGLSMVGVLRWTVA